MKRGSLLLTQDPYLAVETGLSLPHGLEMGPFSYFSGWPREKAEKCHVLNREMMNELIDTCDAQVAAFSGYGFAMDCPSITKLPDEERAALYSRVEKRYSLFGEVPEFGQAGTTLKIYLKK